MIEPSFNSNYCVHCKILLPSYGQFTWQEQQFCCQACLTAHKILTELDSRPEGEAQLTWLDQTRFLELNFPEVLAKYLTTPNTMRFYAEGLDCVSCLATLEILPQYCPDLKVLKVHLDDQTIHVQKTPEGSFQNIALTIEHFGYRVFPVAHDSQLKEFQKMENRKELLRVALAGFFTGNVMLLSVSIYGGLDGPMKVIFDWVMAGLSIPVLTFCAWPIYKKAWSGVKSQHLNLDLPIALALVAGGLLSFYSLGQGLKNTYFDSLDMLVFLLLSSRLFIKFIQKKFIHLSHLRRDLFFKPLRVWQDSQWVLQPIEKVQLNDRIQVEPGDIFPFDSQLLEGQISLDTSILTGEVFPVDLGQNARIQAGTRVLSGNGVALVLEMPKDSALEQLLKVTDPEQEIKPTLVSFADRVGQYFVWGLLLTSLITAILVYPHSPIQAIERVLTLLIVACPCVFGMAIPLAYSLALKKASTLGILIKSPEVFDSLLKIKKIHFDKTGTLSSGEMQTSIQLLDEDPQTLPLLFALEKNQKHPLAYGMIRALRKLEVPEPLSTAQDVILRPEGGIEGWIENQKVALLPIFEDKTRELSRTFNFQVGGINKARIDVLDSLRPEAPAVASQLKNHYQLSILSGDHSQRVHQVADELKISDSHSQLPALEKARHIDPDQDLMVGDGVNDILALDKARVGIAFHGPLELTLQSADICFMKTDLNLIPTLFELSKRLRKVLIACLLFSSSFNLFSGTLAVLGYMQPLWAAIIMPLSSLLVFTIAFIGMKGGE